MDVPGRSCNHLDMQPNAEQRADLAERMTAERLRRFDGNRKRAYTAAEINSNTWDRAEKGKTIAERSLVAIVKLLWPETGGDWQRIAPPLGDVPELLSADMLEEIRHLSPKTREYVLRALGADQDQAERGETS